MNTKRVIFVGDSTHHEFRDAVAWLREYCQLTVCDSLTAASLQLVQSAERPSAIVLGQKRPGVLAQSEIERLRLKAWPIPLIALLGGWCEGELRNGDPRQGVKSVYWHRFISQLGSALQQQATPDDIPAFHGGGGLIMIRSASREAYEALSEGCNAVGYSTVWLPPPRPVFATCAAYGIWDCPGSVRDYGEELGEFACQMYPASVVAVLGFPRVEDCAAALSSGATSVISKPYLQSELWSTLANAASSARRAA